MIPAAAEQLVADFAGQHHGLTGAYEKALVEFALLKLADPQSPYGPLLDDICRQRWTVGQFIRARAS
jgi:hypothetical protein